jgi:hypothetical protein
MITLILLSFSVRFSLSFSPHLQQCIDVNQTLTNNPIVKIPSDNIKKKKNNYDEDKKTI